jgi:hypothetical protein
MISNLPTKVPPRSTVATIRGLPRPRVGQLRDVEGWLSELSSLYRACRRGTLDPSDGTKLAFIASVASRLAKELQELRVQSRISQQLAELQARGVGVAYDDRDLLGHVEPLDRVDEVQP